MAKRWSCLDHDKRIQLEALIRAGHSKKEVAALLGCHLSTGILGWKTASEAFRDACEAEGITISPYLSQFLS